MVDALNYRILPIEEQAPEVEVEAPLWVLLLLFLVLATLLSQLGIVVIGENLAGFALALAFFIVAIVIAPIARGRLKNKLLAVKKEKLRSTRAELSERETRERTQSAKLLLASFGVNSKILAESVSGANQSLMRAEREFQERAFAPFWDKIEESATALGIFNASLCSMETDSASYSKLLEGRVHDFLALTTTSVAIPDPRPSVEDFRRLVRNAQRDFEFATIWEHHKTRRVRIESFHTLGEAVSNLGSLIEDTFSRATAAIEEGSARIREEQPLLREAFKISVARWEKQLPSK